MNPSELKIGILGGGQLGRMFLQEAANLDMLVDVLDPSEVAPCKHLCNRFVRGDFNDYQTVMDFASDKDVLTVEIEHVSTKALKELEQKGVKVCPSAFVLETVQDKGLQKAFYEKHQIPSSPYRLVSGISELKSLKPDFPFVQKLRTGGYDGRGVQLIRREADLNNAFDAPSVIEEMVVIKKELAVIVSRDAAGNTLCFPSVEMVFHPEANLVEYLFAPAEISEEMEKQAGELAKRTAEAFDLCGLMAVELFLSKDNKLLVNEVAPRPHNSGHHTIEANYSSQYAQLARILSGLPAGNTESRSFAAMVNLLGAEGHSGNAFYQGLEAAMAMKAVYIHLYGKKETRPYRKMGHVTITGDSADEVKEKALKVKNLIKVISK